ncbi:unnamed protein product [Rotaria socialis]|uniref:Nucleotide exchange factor Fes1 domain-containing protein n=2 Tax=Rotaria socialis TaxID=392032 RepID=A0A818BG81_9BILA|nr:unnamed protein product [Rotaria socialis]CAF3301456.1 unnamed protein product [Rotaria socialis]CAF3402790.1 unnamed protein product [Rotaria socialis]CAF3416311.1 unnamed protein product [Rotaria socialis]CAF4170729.1 unnamed protein product [Rotaria socialis]
MADNSKQGFLNSLFQWTVKNTAAEPTTTSDLKPMDEPSKSWLNNALENLTVNPVERLKLCISKIKDNQTSEQQKKEFLDELCHWAEELDLAKDFFTIGGLDILAPLLDSNDDDICIQTCSLIANLVQNHEHCQRIIVQSGLQQKLLSIVRDSNNPDLKTKAVTAISALIRGYTLGQLQLQKYHGAKVLIQAIPSSIPRLQNKLCFLINTLCSSSAHMKKIFYENDALTEFVRLFNSESCPDHQHTLETILTLSSAKPNAMSSLVESDPLLVEAFLEKLTERRQIIQDSEDHLDEINIINQIRTLLTPTSTEDKLVPEMKTTQHIVPIS